LSTPNLFAPFWMFCCAIGRTPVRSRSSSGAISLVALCTLVVALCGLVLVPGAQADDAAKKIQQIGDSDDLAKNQTLCAEIIRSGPRKYALYFCEGYEAIFRGDHGAAAKSLESALEEQSDFALAAIYYGDAYKQLGDLKRAEEYYQRAIDVQPRRTDSRFSLGSLYLEQAKQGDESYYPKALETFRQMAETNPRSSDGYTNMGVVLTEMGRFDDAESVLKKAIEKAPQDPFTHDNLALLYSRKNQVEDAARLWRQALTINPGYGPAAIELASLYGRNGELLQALQALRAGERAIAAPPWGPEIRRNLGFAFLGIGAIDRARDVFENAAATGTNDALTHLGLAHLRMTEAKAPEALTAFRRGAALDPVAAAPFVLAWKAAVEFAIEDDETGPLASLVTSISENEADALAAHGVVGNTSGHSSTDRLVQFVLPGWQFDDAEVVSSQVNNLDASISLHGYDEAPVPIARVAADYPDSAEEQGIEGEVLVRVIVDTNGRVTEASAETGNADPILIDAAIIAAQKWRFEPATRYGEPVEASITIPFRFVKRD